MNFIKALIKRFTSKENLNRNQQMRLIAKYHEINTRINELNRYDEIGNIHYVSDLYQTQALVYQAVRTLMKSKEPYTEEQLDQILGEDMNDMG